MSDGTCHCPTRYDRPIHYAGLFRKDPKSPLVDEIIQQYSLGLETGLAPYGYIISQAYILQTNDKKTFVVPYNNESSSHRACHKLHVDYRQEQESGIVAVLITTPEYPHQFAKDLLHHIHHNYQQKLYTIKRNERGEEEQDYLTDLIEKYQKPKIHWQLASQ